MLWIIGLFAMLAVTGFLLQELVAGKGGVPLAEKACAAPALGAAVIGSSLVLCLILLDRFAAFLLFAIPAVLLFAWLGRKLFLRDKTPDPAGAHSAPHVSAADACFVALAAAFAALMLAIAFTVGAGGDYISIWAFKALVLSENSSIRIPEFLDEKHYHHHKDYPLLFPCIQAVLYRVSGQVLDRSAKLLYPMLLWSSSLALYFHLKRKNGLTAGLVGGGLCLFTPAICGHHPGVCSAYMDIPLGCFVMLAFISCRAWLDKGKRSDAFVGGLFLTAACMTKNEGAAAAALAVLILAAYGLRRGFKGAAPGLLTLVLPLAIVGGAWFAFRSGLSAGGSDYIALFLESTLIDNISRVPAVAIRFLLEFIHFERWGFLWILLAATAPLWVKKGGVPAGIFLAGILLIHMAAIVVSPLDLGYQLASAAARLPGQIAPLAALCVGIGFGLHENFKEHAVE